MTASNARVIAELQAFRIALALVGGDLSKVPEIMKPQSQQKEQDQ
jgi:hypothetical protein